MQSARKGVNAPYPIDWAKIQTARKRAVLGAIPAVLCQVPLGATEACSSIRYLGPVIFGLYAIFVIACLARVRCPVCGGRAILAALAIYKGRSSRGECVTCAAQLGPF